MCEALTNLNGSWLKIKENHDNKMRPVAKKTPKTFYCLSRNSTVWEVDCTTHCCLHSLTIDIAFVNDFIFRFALEAPSVHSLTCTRRNDKTRPVWQARMHLENLALITGVNKGPQLWRLIPLPIIIYRRLLSISQSKLMAYSFFVVIVDLDAQYLTHTDGHVGERTYKYKD